MTTNTVPTAGPETAAALSAQINAVSLALATMVQSATAPTAGTSGYASIAGMFWHDTSANQLKVRDQANTTWIVLGSLDETGKTFVPVAATQANMETATSLVVVVTPGIQKYHPAHPKALGNFQFTKTAVSSTMASVDTTNDVITWTAAHGLALGDFIYSTNGTWPAGWGDGAIGVGYYVKLGDQTDASPTTKFRAYPTYDDAVAGTNILNLTSSTSGRTASKLSMAVAGNFGLAATAPFQPVSGTPIGGSVDNTAQIDVVLATALSDINSMSAAGSWRSKFAATTTTRIRADHPYSGRRWDDATVTGGYIIVWGDYA